MRKQVRCNQRYHTPLKKELVATSVSGVNMNKKLFFKKQKRKEKKNSAQTDLFIRTKYLDLIL